METTDFAKHLTNFLTGYLAGERNASPNTICSYRDTFVQLIFFMKRIKGMDAHHLTLDRSSKRNHCRFSGLGTAGKKMWQCHAQL